MLSVQLRYPRKKRVVQTFPYFLTIYQKASGKNLVDGQDVPVQAEIGTSESFIGNSGVGADTQLVFRIGLEVKF
jgi:hypothetical protein